jgi:hypothetical protein
VPDFVQPLRNKNEGELIRIDEDDEEYDSEIKTESTFFVLEAK